MTPSIVARASWVNDPRVAGPVATAREVWLHRRFVKHLGLRALRKLYARTALGWVWILIFPLFPILLRVLVFGGLLGVTATGIPYFLFLTIGTAVWNFFSSALMWSTRGLEMNRKVLSRVYVPAIILPVATMTPALFDLTVNICVLVIAVAWYWIQDGTVYVVVGAQSLWSVVSLALTLMLALGIGFFTSIWGETARDARFTMAQVTTVWFLLTPVLYPVSMLPAKYRGWLALNPMASFIETFKYGLLGTEPPDPFRLATAVALTTGVFIWGLWFFTGRSEEDSDG